MGVSRKYVEHAVWLLEKGWGALGEMRPAIALPSQCCPFWLPLLISPLSFPIEKRAQGYRHVKNSLMGMNGMHRWNLALTLARTNNQNTTLRWELRRLFRWHKMPRCSNERAKSAKSGLVKVTSTSC